MPLPDPLVRADPGVQRNFDALHASVGALHASVSALSSLSGGGVGAISASNSTFSGTVRITGGPNITVGTDASGVSISGAGGTGGGGLGGISASNTVYTSGTVVFTGSNQATVRSTTGQQVVIDVTTASQTVQTQSMVNAISNSQVSRSGTVNLSGAGAVVVGSQTGNAFTISAPAQTAQTGISSIAASDATYTSGQVQFTGSQAVTVRSSAGQRVVIDAPAQSVQSQSLVRAISASNSTFDGTVRVTGGNNITVGTDASGVTISGPNTAAQSVQTQNVHNVSISANASTSGTLAHISSGTLSLVAGPNITLSQNNNTVAISAAAPGAGGGVTLNVFRNMEMGPGATPLSAIDIAAAQRSVLVQPLVDGNMDAFPGNMTASTWFMPISISGSTATMSAAYTSIFRIGIYTNNAGTLSILNSASTSLGSAGAATNNSTLYAGVRWLSFGTAQWSSSPAFSQAQYWWAFHYSTAGVSNQSLSLFGQNMHASNSTSAGTVGAASAANATRMGAAPFYGAYSVTTAALPTAIGSADLNKQVALGVFVPSMLLNNISSAF